MPKSGRTPGIQKGGTRGTVFREVARRRLDDAKVLLDNERYGGAVYLAGYAVECALKHAITRRTQALYLPAAMETHKLDQLLEHSGLKPALDKNLRISALYGSHADFWDPAKRYSASNLKKAEARELYSNMEQLYNWIVEQTHE